jgi:hypothetical protein
MSAMLIVGLMGGCAMFGGSELPQGDLKTDVRSGTITLEKTSDEIMADGSLDEAAWKNAVALSGFVSEMNAEPAVETRVLVTYDKDNLYIAVINDEPNTDKLVAKAEKRDGSVWGDDSVEIYLDPHNRKMGEYYGFFVNSRNVVYDRKANEAWDGDWKSGTKVIDGKAWLVETVIPWNTVNVDPEAGHKLGLMVARNHKANRTRGKQQYLVPCNEEAKDTSKYPVLELR